MRQWRIKRVREILRVAEEAEAYDEEEESGNVAEVMGNLRIETAGTKEKATEQLESAL